MIIKIKGCSIPGAWYENHIGETFEAYRDVTYDGMCAYMVRDAQGYSNIVLDVDIQKNNI